MTGELQRRSNHPTMPSPGVYRIKSADKHAEPLYAGNPPSQIKLGAAVTAVTENESVSTHFFI